MLTLEELASNEKIKEEYKKTFLLNIFQKLCVRMERNASLRENIQTLFRQTKNESETIRAIIVRELNYKLSAEEAEIIKPWFLANLKKSKDRKKLPNELKRKLCMEQDWKCGICGESLGQDLSDVSTENSPASFSLLYWKNGPEKTCQNGHQNRNECDAGCSASAQ